MKRIWGILGVLIAAALSLGAGVRYGSKAENQSSNYTLAAERIHNNLDLKYLYLDGVAGMAANNGDIYVCSPTELFLLEQGLDSAQSILTHGNEIKAIEFCGESLLVLKSDGLYVLGESNAFIEGNFVDFAVLENEIYLITQEKVFYFAVETPENISEIDMDGGLKSITAGGGQIYVLKNDGVQKIQGQNYITAGISDRNIKGLSGNDDYLICFGDNFFEVYSSGGSNLTREKLINNNISVADLCADSSQIYIVDSQSFGISAFNINADYGQSFISAGLGSFDYFYDSPSGVFSRAGQIIVADSYNNRLAILSNQGFLKEDISRPISAIETLDGQTIVAHSISSLTVMGETQKTVPLRIQDLPAQIKKLACDSLDNIFILAEQSGKNYILKTTPTLDAFEIVLGGSVGQIAIGNKIGGGVFAYDSAENKIISISGNSAETYTISQSITLTDFAIDLDGKVYGVDSNGFIMVIDGGEPVAISDENGYSAIAISAVSISANGKNLVDYGDLIVLSTQNHSLSRIKAENAGVSGASGQSFNPQDDIAAHLQDVMTLAKVKRKTPLFALPAESAEVFTVSANAYVFVRTDLFDDEDFCFVAVENQASGKIEYGYIYKSALEDCEFAPPPYSVVKVTLSGKKVYNYPSIYSNEAGRIETNDTVTLISFHADYTDSFGIDWYRVALSNGLEGYITAGNVTDVFLKTDTGQKIKTNATIKAEAPLYIYDSLTKTYVRYEGLESVAAGTKVKIPTPFSSSKPYTKVTFYVDGQLIDIDVYVETQFIDYQGADILKIVMICAIVLTIVLGSVLIIWLFKRRKKRSFQ